MNREEFIALVTHEKNSIAHAVAIKDNCLFLDEKLQLQSDSTKDLCSLFYQQSGIQYPKFHKMDMLCKLGIMASEFVLMDETKPFNDPYKVAMVFQNSSGSLQNDIQYQETLKAHASPALFVYTLPNIVMGEIAIRHGIKGENTFFISDGINREELATYCNVLFKDDVANAILCAYIDFEETNQMVEMYWIRK